MSYDYLFKVIFIGDAYVGKTALVERITLNRNLSHYDGTIGVDFTSLITTINNTERIKVHIWDTAGQEMYSSIISSFYRGITGAAIVFDVTERHSFDKVKFWMNEIKEKADNYKNMSFILIGNKIDLERKRVVSKEEAIELAKNYNIEYVEMSAKSGKNALNGFKKLVKTIYKKMDKDNLTPGIKRHFLDETTILIKKGNEREKCCCIC